jgi:uncharacterized membrane protein YfcA
MITFYILALLITFLGVVINLPGSTHLNPLLLNFYDVRTALFLVAVYMTMGSLCRIIVFRKEIVKDKLIHIILWAILGALAGSVLVGYINEKILIVLFIFAGLKYLYDFYFPKVVKEETQEIKSLFRKYADQMDEFIAGFVASFMQVFGLGTGPIRQGYYISKGYSMAATQGTVGFMFFFSGLAMISGRMYFENIDPKLILILLPLFPFMLALVYAGKFIINKIPKIWQDRIIIYTLIISLLTVVPKLLN